jgi:tetratricopeptide (TPR) repeat protein
LIRTWLLLIAALGIFTLNGCSGSIHRMSDWLRSGPWWTSAQAPDVVNRARELEAQGELRLAVAHWGLVRQIATDPTEADREIQRLSQAIAQATRDHFNAGLKAFNQGQSTDARNHFLAALRLDPAFDPALRQINAHFSGFPLAAFISEPGDRPASIARKHFGDEKKAFLVTWFNDLPADAALAPGTLLILPKLEKAPPVKRVPEQPPDTIAAARARLAENDLDGAMAIATAADATDPEVKTLIQTIHLQKADQLIKSGRLEDGQHSLAMVPDGFPGKDAVARSLLGATQRRQFDVDLATAREDFDEGRYQQCLGRVDALLILSPDNRQAADLATEARYRLALDHFDHQRYMDARDMLETIDDTHAAGAELQSVVNSRLAECAQNHYRNGVKHYINEKLQAAITEWEKALACDPDHAKARENIENATRILQKIETMP